MTGVARTAIVAGGGIGGLCAVIGLRRAGVEATVYERVEESAPVGAGISLWPNAVRALPRPGRLPGRGGRRSARPALGESNTVVTALAAYEAARRDRAAMFVKESRRVGRLAQLRKPVGRWLRNAVMRRASTESQLKRMDPLLGGGV